MAATIYGQPGKNPGEQLVYQLLGSLPNGCIVYSEPKLVYRSEVRKPDFVIVNPDWGVIVLEVKDWYDIADRDRKSAWLGKSQERKTSPVEQACQAAHVLENMLKEDPDLRSYAGGLDFYYAYAGALPFLPPTTIAWLEEAWGENYLVGQHDLRPDRLTDKLSAIDGFSVQRLMMTEEQVRAVCAIVDGLNKAKHHTTGEFKGVYDRLEENIGKERPPSKRQPEQRSMQPEPVQARLDPDLTPTVEARTQHLEGQMPDDVKPLTSATHVRLVRGFAGTGKTDVLILRARYLYREYPDLQILVTTFNDPLWRERLKPELAELETRVDVIKCDSLCSRIYRKKHGMWTSPQHTQGVVSAMKPIHPLIDELGRDFVAEEFIWMKETGRTEREAYVTQVREGRGGQSGQRLSQTMKEQVFELFEAYQQRLQDLPAYDWVDLHTKTLQYLEEGVEPDKLYDVILIDEAQHFAPTWMRIIERFLKPGGSLFLCDDPSQSVYRYYSWRQKGVEVVGRTRWLRIPYRNTRQIFEAAYALIKENPLAQKLLAEDGEQASPHLEGKHMRQGPPPQVHRFSSVKDECDFVTAEIVRLVESGIAPNEIGILHEKKHVLSRYRPLVPHGVQLYEIKRQTGLEYKAVFVPQLQQLFARTIGTRWEEDEARNLLKCYMTMTRARDRLYLLYSQNWPSFLEPLRSYVQWNEEKPDKEDFPW
jgi:hypothetical protein